MCFALLSPVLKIIKLNQDGEAMEEYFNLRVGRSNQTKNCTDVVWSPFESKGAKSPNARPAWVSVAC